MAFYLFIYFLLFYFFKKSLFSKKCWFSICLPSRSVSLRSIFTLYSAGVWLRLRSASRGRLRVKAGFSPRTLCPFSLASWKTSYWSVITCDTRSPHTHSRTVGCELWMVRLQEQLLKIILFTCSTGVGSAFTSWSKPQEPQMEEMCSLIFYYITVARFLPQLRFAQMSLSPSWLPVSHYHRDNHPVHNTQDAVCR